MLDHVRRIPLRHLLHHAPNPSIERSIGARRSAPAAREMRHPPTPRGVRPPSSPLVATDSMQNVETVTLGTWVGIGARDEAPEVNGISHLLEHMVFKGTERRTAR